jgi:CubicO group peptidase (beta-lactamase class C family)
MGRQADRPYAYVKAATTAARTVRHGFLWWLNTTGKWQGAPTSAFEAQGQGGNVIHIDPVHDLVVVWRWSAQSQQGFKEDRRRDY